jgi:hypothetical protein
MSFVQKLFTSYKEFTGTESYIGQLHRIWYDGTTDSMRIGDAVTELGLGIGDVRTIRQASILIYNQRILAQNILEKNI